MAFWQELDCHTEVVRFLKGSEKHRRKQLARCPKARLDIRGSKTFARTSSPQEFDALVNFLSDYDDLEFEFDKEKILRARSLSKLQREELNHRSLRYDADGDIYIRWRSKTKVLISGVKVKLREKLIELKYLVNYETINSSFTPDTHRILSAGGVHDEMRRKFGHKLLIKRERDNEITFIGGRREITEASVFLTKKRDAIKRVPLEALNFDEKRIKFLCNCMGQQATPEEKRVMSTIHKGITAAVLFLRDGTVEVAAMDNEMIQSALHSLMIIIICVTFKPYSALAPDALRYDDCKEISQKLLEKYAVLIVMEDDDIYLLGLHGNVFRCIREMNDYGMETITTLTPAAAKIFGGVGREYLRSFEFLETDILMKDTGEVVLRGKKNAFATVKEVFLSKVSQIETREFQLKTPIVHFLASDEGREFLSEFENTHDCSILLPETAKVIPTNELPQTQARYDPNVLSHCSVTTAAGSDVQIQLYGCRDVTNFRCDVLVHLSSSVTLTSAISRAILMKAGQEVENSLRFHLSWGKANEPLLTSAGEIFCCKTIVHYCFASGRNNAKSSNEVVHPISSIFRSADTVDAEVVAIPLVLGSICGLESIGKSLVEVLETGMPQSLKRVVIIGIHSSTSELVGEFKRRVVGSLSTESVNQADESETKTIILKRAKLKHACGITSTRYLGDDIEWEDYVRRRVMKARENEHTGVEIFIPPHRNPANSAKVMKRVLGDLKQDHLRTFQLAMLEDDTQTILAYEATFCGLESLTPKRRSQTSIGPIEVSVKIGDITEETSDAIVNSTNRFFDLSQGSLSSKILLKAGFTVAVECRHTTGRFVRITNAGLLPCKKILHASVSRDREEYRKILLEILKTANDHKLSTVSFPAIGAGNVGLSCEVAAVEMRRAIEEFAGTNPLHLTVNKINIVVTEENAMNEYLKWIVDARRREGDDILQAIFEILLVVIQALFATCCRAWRTLIESCSQSTDCTKVLVSAFSLEGVRKARILLPSGIESHKKTEIIHGSRHPLCPWHRWKVERLKKTCGVDISRSHMGDIVITGFSHNPLSARREIEEMLDRYPERGALIPIWQRGSRKPEMAFTQSASMALERGFEERLPVIHVEDYIEDGDYLVKYDILLSEMYSVAGGNKAKLWRIAKPIQEIGLPEKWQEMGKIPLRIPISPESDEFKQVERILSERDSTFRVIFIERIQNKALYKQYKVKKEEATHKHAKRKSIEIERVLFHGTSEEAIENIYKNGFNRSYSGKNATLFGHGTYFALEPKTAHIYAEEAIDKSRQIFMADVLTGVFKQGSERDRVLPKIEGTSDHYDSLVDDATDPKKFVIFHDAAAYPTYLIKYRIKS